MSLLDTVLKTYWAITPEAFQQIINFVSRNYNPIEIVKTVYGDYQKYVSILKNKNIEGLLKQDDPVLANSYNTTYRQNVAIIPVVGPIVPRNNLLTLFGATSVTTIAKDFNTALNNDKIDTIILNFDTPGGEITGISELAQMIYTARNQKNKKILSYVYGLGASAGYWLLSATSDVWAIDTAQVGSIGIVAGYVDRSKADEKAGISYIEIISSISPLKNVSPNTDEGRAQIQKTVDDLAAIFVNAVAKYRNTTETKVISDFGKGDIVLAKEALNNNMIDKIGSLEEMIDIYIKPNNFRGGLMSLTVAQIKTESLETYNAILEEGKRIAEVDIETKIQAAKEEGFKAGIKAERERLQSIETLKVPGAENFIATHKYDEGMTREKLAALILDEQEKIRNVTMTKHTTDAFKLGVVAKDVSKTLVPDSEDVEEKVVISNIVAGANKKIKNFM